MVEEDMEDMEALEERWKRSPIDITDDYLKIQNLPVMEAWEHPYMAKLAEIAASSGGKVLELGFGMGISATYLQDHDLTEHWICEANLEVCALAHKWSTFAKSKVVVLEGFSWDITPKLADGSFDGILSDTYKLSAGDSNQYHRRALPLEEAARLLRPGGVYTHFCSEPVAINSRDLSLLDAAGFDVTYVVVDVPTPQDCQYWSAKTLVAPLCVKRA